MTAKKAKKATKRRPRVASKGAPEQALLEIKHSPDPKVIREIVRARMAEDDFKLANDLVDSLITLARFAERDSDKQRAIDKLFQYHEPPPAQEKPKAAQARAPEAVRKSVVVHATLADLEKLDPESAAFGVLRKQIVLDTTGKGDQET